MPKIIIFIFLLLFTSHAIAKNDFVPGISDLPVPANFHLLDDNSSVFYNESGRFIQASFKGKGNHKDTIDFYLKTLPALGWKLSSEPQSLKFEKKLGTNPKIKQAKKLEYIRDNELLKIKIFLKKSEKSYDELQINFLLKPN